MWNSLCDSWVLGLICTLDGPLNNKNLLIMHSRSASARPYQQNGSQQAEEFEISQDAQVFRDPTTINNLNQCLEGLKNFMKDLQQLASTPTRNDVMEHCDKIKESRREKVGCERVLQMTKNRIQKMIKNKKIKRNWGNQDIQILVWVVSKYADLNNFNNLSEDLTSEHWVSISQLIPGSTADSCMFRWLSLKKNKLSDNNWAQKQSLLLDQLVAYIYLNCSKYGEDDWTFISESLYKLNTIPKKVFRCPKQCREHWSCYLNPNLKKGPWMIDEDLILLEEIKKRGGEKRWTQLVKYLRGRTENALKNRYNLILQKQKKHYNSPEPHDESFLIDSFLKRSFSKLDSNSISISRILDSKSSPCSRELKPEIEDQTAQRRILRKRKQKKSMLEEQSQLQIRYHKHEKTTSLSGFAKTQSNHNMEYNFQNLSPEKNISGCILKQPSESLIFNQLQSEPMISFIDFRMKDISGIDMHRGVDMSMGSIYGFDERENLPCDIDKIKIISMDENEDMFVKLRQIMRESNTLSIVPCAIQDNRLIKISHI